MPITTSQLNNRLAVKCLENAQQLELQGEFYQAFLALNSIWSDLKETPKVESLDLSIQGEVWLRCGSILNALSSAKQTKERERSKGFLTKAWKIFSYLCDHKGKSDTANALGYAYQREGTYKESEAWLKTSLEINTESNSPSRIQAHNHLAITLCYQKRFSEALRLLKAIEPAALICGDHNLLACFHHQYFFALDGLNELNKAETHLRLSIGHLENSGNRFFQATAENSLAHLCRKLGRLPEAKLHALKAIEITRAIGTAGHEARFLDTLAQIYLAEKNPDPAIKICEQSIELLTRGDDYASLLESYTTLCHALLATGNRTESYKVLSIACTMAADHLGQETADMFSKRFDELLLSSLSRSKSFSPQSIQFSPETEEICYVADEIENNHVKRLVVLPGIENQYHLIGRIQGNNLEHYGLPEGTKVLIEKTNEVTIGELSVVKEKGKKVYHFGFITYHHDLRLYEIDFKNDSEHEPLIFGSGEVDFIGRVVGFCPRDEISSIVKMKPLGFSI
ncbi:MAG TPA: tetratricopeptide repeat protein [Pyrinomonadaceae bacterium]